MLRISHTVYPDYTLPFDQWAQSFLNNRKIETPGQITEKKRVYQYDEKMNFVRFHVFDNIQSAISGKKQIQERFPSHFLTFKPI